MRITIISPDIFPYAAGYGARDPYNIALALSSRGHNITVLASVPRSATANSVLNSKRDFNILLFKLSRSGNSYINYYFPLLPMEYIRLFKVLRSLAMTDDAFILNGTLESLSSAFLLFVPSSVKKRTIFINHGLPNPRSALLNKVSSYFHTVFCRFFLNVSYVISYSKQSEESLRTKLSKHNCTDYYITNLGINCKDFLTRASKILERTLKISSKLYKKYNIKGEYIYAVGRFERNKGYDELLEAFEVLSEESTGIQLVISGELTGYTDYLLGKYHHLINSKRVIFTGRVDEDTKIFLMLNCKLYVISSIREGFGGGAIEAQLLGINTLATRTGKMDSILNRCNSIIVEPGSVQELIKGIRSGLSLMKPSISISIEKCKPFSVENTVDIIQMLWNQSIFQKSIDDL